MHEILHLILSLQDIDQKAIFTHVTGIIKSDSIISVAVLKLKEKQERALEMGMNLQCVMGLHFSVPTCVLSLI